MFTDKELVKLRLDKNYKKSKSFLKNVHLTNNVIKTGISGISISFSSAGTASVSIAALSFFWVVLRYWFITREITCCRAKIIEGLLNTSFIIPKDRLIRDSIGSGSKWLEYKTDKVSAVKHACVEYIETVENRAVLAEHSFIRENGKLTEIFKTALSEIEQIFESAIDELRKKEIKAKLLEYPNALSDVEISAMVQRIFLENSVKGNLTAGKEEDKRGI